jgi:hypothetical protein
MLLKAVIQKGVQIAVRQENDISPAPAVAAIANGITRVFITVMAFTALTAATGLHFNTRLIYECHINSLIGSSCPSFGAIGRLSLIKNPGAPRWDTGIFKFQK